jgi:hypothetical protein
MVLMQLVAESGWGGVTVTLFGAVPVSVALALTVPSVRLRVAVADEEPPSAVAGV